MDADEELKERCYWEDAYMQPDPDAWTPPEYDIHVEAEELDWYLHCRDTEISRNQVQLPTRVISKGGWYYDRTGRATSRACGASFVLTQVDYDGWDPEDDLG